MGTDKGLILVGIEAIGNLVPFFVPGRAQFLWQVVCAAISLSTLVYLVAVAVMRRREHRPTGSPWWVAHRPLLLLIGVLLGIAVAEQVAQQVIGNVVGGGLALVLLAAFAWFALAGRTWTAIGRRRSTALIVTVVVLALVAEQVAESLVAAWFGGVASLAVLAISATCVALWLRRRAGNASLLVPGAPRQAPADRGWNRLRIALFGIVAVAALIGTAVTRTGVAAGVSLAVFGLCILALLGWALWDRRRPAYSATLLLGAFAALFLVEQILQGGVFGVGGGWLVLALALGVALWRVAAQRAWVAIL